MTQIIQNLSEILPRYQAVFCDVWGVVHNGITPFPSAVEALMKARVDGAYVSLVTNSPRTEPELLVQLENIGVPRTAFDNVATAGEAMQQSFFATAHKKYYFIGRNEDNALFRDLPEGAVNNKVEANIDEADCIIVADIDHARPHPDDYEIELRKAAERGLPLYCANPDIVVDKGDKRIWCAGAIAQKYEALGGGPVFHFGKPHAPIYTLAQRKMRMKLDRDIPASDILFIGDGIATDLKGAMQEDMDALFVSGGLAFEETRTNRNADAPTPDKALLDKFLSENQSNPLYTIGMLR